MTTPVWPPRTVTLCCVTVVFVPLRVCVCVSCVCVCVSVAAVHSTLCYAVLALVAVCLFVCPCVLRRVSDAAEVAVWLRLRLCFTVDACMPASVCVLRLLYAIDERRRSPDDHSYKK